MTRMCAAVFASSLVVAGRVASAQPMPPPFQPWADASFRSRSMCRCCRSPDGPTGAGAALVAMPPLCSRTSPTSRRRGRSPRPGRAAIGPRNSDGGYDQARQLIDSGRYERALEALDRVAAAPNSTRADAALYWKAYAQWKLDQRADALATLADMRKRFPQSRWAKDAQALDVEIRQRSGDQVSPDGQASEELKLLALRGLMNSDPERAIPMVEQILAGPSTVRVKENALFVLSQSRSQRGRDIIAGAAKGSLNPDLQLRAIRYLGAIGGAENRQVLDEAYRSTTDLAVKRAIIRSFGAAGDRQRLLGLAKSESAPELRGEAVRSLGAMNATAELDELYQTETSAEVKNQIIRGMVASGNVDSLDQARHVGKGPGAAPHGDPQPRLDGIRENERDPAVDLHQRPRRRRPHGSDRRADDSAERDGARRPRARREGRRLETSDRRAVVGDEVEGSNRLHARAVEMTAWCRVQGAGCGCGVRGAACSGRLSRSDRADAQTLQQRIDAAAVEGGADLDRVPRADGRRLAAVVLLRFVGAADRGLLRAMPPRGARRDRHDRRQSRRAGGRADCRRAAVRDARRSRASRTGRSRG